MRCIMKDCYQLATYHIVPLSNGTTREEWTKDSELQRFCHTHAVTNVEAHNNTVRKERRKHSICGQEIHSFYIVINEQKKEHYAYRNDMNRPMYLGLVAAPEVQSLDFAIHLDGCNKPMNAEETLWVARFSYDIHKEGDGFIARLFNENDTENE